TRDDHLEAGGLRAGREIVEALRGALCRHDPAIVRNAQLTKRIGCMAHGRPVRLAAHDDGDVTALAGHVRPHAMMSGMMRSSSLCMRSLSVSFFFFMRCICSGSQPIAIIALIAASKSMCSCLAFANSRRISACSCSDMLNRLKI